MSPRRYAERTKVPVERSKVAVEKLLRQHGAEGFLTGWDGGIETLMFRLEGKTVRFSVPVPQAEEFDDGSRTWKQTEAAAAAEHRRRWRALLLIIRAKLEMVAGGDSTFEHEFLADILLPDGSTVGEWMTPQIEDVAQMGAMPKMLPSGD